MNTADRNAAASFPEDNLSSAKSGGGYALLTATTRKILEEKDILKTLRTICEEACQVLEADRFLFERVMNVGAVVVVPDLLGPRVRAGFVVIEENHVRLHTLGVKDARRQAQDRVKVGVLQQLAPDRLARPAFEQHVIRHDDRSPSGRLQHRADMLHKIELLV